MRKALLLFPVLLFTLGILFPCFKSCEIAPEPSPQQDTQTATYQNEYNPRIVKVGIYIINIGKFDVATGEFTVDIYLNFTSDRPGKSGNITDFEFCNGLAVYSDTRHGEPNEEDYRIEAVLHNNLNLSKYPFDSHNITIELEDKFEKIEEMEYEVNENYTKMDESLKIAGWDIVNDEPYVINHKYVENTYSRYVYAIEIRRPVMAGFLKTILPVLIMVIVGLLSLQFSPDKYIARLTLITGSLTGAVILHLNITSSIPPLGYLTLGDRFMLFNYLALALTLISTLVLMYYGDKAKTIPLSRISRLSMIFIPILWIGLQVINFLVL